MFNKTLTYIKEHQFAFLIFIFSFLSMMTLISPNVVDFDYWFHYNAGEYFTNTGEVPKIPINSWWGLENNLPWISHEWLFGVIIYKLTELIGQSGVIVLSHVVVSISVGLAFLYKYKEWKKQPVLYVVALALLCNTLKTLAVPRPQIILFLLTIALFYILLKERDKPGMGIYLLAPLTILWTNLHGGSYILIFVFTLVLIITDSFNFSLGRIEFKKVDFEITKRRLRALILSFLLVSVNGHGLEMYYYPISNFTDKVMISSISEWQPVNIHKTYDLFGFLPVVLMFCAMIATKKKIRPFDIMVLGAFGFLSLKSIRFLAQSGIVLFMIMPYYFDSLEFMSDKVRDKYLKIILSFGIMFISLIAISGTVKTFEKPIGDKYFYSDAMIEKLKEIKPKRLYNSYDMGGYLVYKDIDVFIDGRADIYSRSNMVDHLSIERVGTNIDELIYKYNFDYLLIHKDGKLDYWMNHGQEQEKQFELIYQDHEYKLYKNNNYNPNEKTIVLDSEK